MNSVQNYFETIRANVGKVIIGRDQSLRLLLAAILSGGHVLLEDVPGVGKTMLARALAVSIGCDFRRIQCTPDLLPSDVTGTSVFDQQKQAFSFHPGPIFAQIVLVDEINRATPRTQSSLLECMAEGQVTVDGAARPLPQPFFVMATQNPIEYEGTFPLPEAQLDRFFLKLSLGYPTSDEENTILETLRGDHPISSLQPAASGQDLLKMKKAIQDIHVAPTLRDYIVRLIQATRAHRSVQLGCSPRGSLALYRAAQSLAALAGRDYVEPEDIQDAAVPVLSHRVIVRSEQALRGMSGRTVIEELLRQTPVDVEAN